MAKLYYLLLRPSDTLGQFDHTASEVKGQLLSESLSNRAFEQLPWDLMHVKNAAGDNLSGGLPPKKFPGRLFQAVRGPDEADHLEKGSAGRKVRTRLARNPIIWPSQELSLTLFLFSINWERQNAETLIKIRTCFATHIRQYDWQAAARRSDHPVDRPD